MPFCTTTNRAASLRFMDFVHIPMVHGGNLTIVPGDRDRVPARSDDAATIWGTTAPTYPIALAEFLRFGGGHAATPLLAIQ